MQMMRILLIGALTLVSAAPIIAQPWRDLFNGRDLTGWEFMGNGLASVADGEISIAWDEANPGGGWLMTTESFENFRVQADYYAPGATNSGFAIRYQGERGEDPAFYGYEIQIFNDPTQAQDFTGSIYKLARSFWRDVKPMDWNTMDITANGEHIVVRINGTQVNHVHDRRSLRGRIGFQSHDAKTVVKVRNVRIQELPATPDLGPPIEDWMRHSNKGRVRTLFDGETLTGWTPVGTGDWSIEDGAIVGRHPGPTGGFLTTDNEYQNFYLKLKFRIAYDDNSGVWIRWDGIGDRFTLDNAMEINVYDHSDVTFNNPTGSIAEIARSYNGTVDYDDWNMMEIFAFDDHICVYVNGVKASEGHAPAMHVRAGKIGLQVGPHVPTGETSTVSFKDITIKEFDRSRWNPDRAIPFMGF